MILSRAAIIVALLLGGSLSAQADPILNGGFEAATPGDLGSAPTGWDLGDEAASLPAPAYFTLANTRARSGSYHATIYSPSDYIQSGESEDYVETIIPTWGYISQTISTTPGESLRIAAYMLGSVDDQIGIWFNGTPVLIEQLSASWLDYEEFAVDVVGTGTDVLTFGFYATTAQGLLLDDVGVVPEPASLALLGLGLVGLGLARRRRAG